MLFKPQVSYMYQNCFQPQGKHQPIRYKIFLLHTITISSLYLWTLLSDLGSTPIKVYHVPSPGNLQLKKECTWEEWLHAMFDKWCKWSQPTSCQLFTTYQWKMDVPLLPYHVHWSVITGSTSARGSLKRSWSFKKNKNITRLYARNNAKWGSFRCSP